MRNDTYTPDHLGISLDFTGKIPRVCMPYKVFKPYSHLHGNYSITIFLGVFMLTTPSPSIALSSHFSMPYFLLTMPCLALLNMLLSFPLLVYTYFSSSSSCISVPFSNVLGNSSMGNPTLTDHRRTRFSTPHIE